ncbi:MbnP family protein [Cyclobacterium marinum]|uniref:Copper-binding protein MbnP-like domain-containing protein n=1 Tax=Cyclobacterium marinum (strain ATCC 25205 / DSM 745 / LMG 13164 / NCIMB 1802) TaxID=880070 RepID=G0J840_CYCMS|nr:MbnP family protein [Cyclobacterium marinum]AEL27820.1 hypothetical protein Cycma_4116 [Cyclobacterium marinum DSM 745]
MKKYLAIGSLVLASVSCTETEVEYIEKEVEMATAGETTLVLDARYGDADFELNKAMDYKFVDGGEEVDLKYEFSNLRYWVSNVILVNEDGEEFLVPDSHYLVEETNEIPIQEGSYNKVYPAKKREEIELSGIPVGNYSGVKFSIGVAPEYNDNLSLQSGELNPLNGMSKSSWHWHTSYIFTSISGEMEVFIDEPESKSFIWEVGSNDYYIQKEVQFESPITISSKTNSTINLEYDVEKSLEIDAPWENSFIGASTPELMEKLTNNHIAAISLVSAEFELK